MARERTKDWIKYKIMTTDDCVVCGYIIKKNNIVSLVIGQYDGDELICMGHVTPVSLRVLNQHKYAVINYSPFGYMPSGNENAVWLAPELVCIVESMPTEREGFRRAVFRGIRGDKLARESVIKD